MSELDDEELIATRRLNGVDDNLFKENIEIGEYVRNKDGYIDKVKKIIEPNKDEYFEETYYICDIVMASSYKSEIVKHSKQLIDLIEVGDIVNKLEITSFTEKDKGHKERIAWHNTFYGDDDIATTNNEIKTILTKELYMANCYKVGGEDGI